MKNDNNIDDLITYNIDGVNYKFKSNPAMLDIFKSIIETLPLQKYLDNERSKRNIEPQQPSTGSTGSIWNFKPTSPTHQWGLFVSVTSHPHQPVGGIIWFKTTSPHPVSHLLLNIDGCSTHTPTMLFWLLELFYFWEFKQLYICFVWIIKFQPFQYHFEKTPG